jgi:hypothetical protein
MIHLGLNQIPDFHIMKRWTKSARDILGPNIEGSVDTEVSLPKSFRHNIMYVSALELLKMGDVSESRYRIVMKNIKAAKKELREDRHSGCSIILFQWWRGRRGHSEVYC